MADDSLMKDSGIAVVCVTLLGGIGYGLKWIGQKILDMLLGQIKERIEQMDQRIKALEQELRDSKERECRFFDCPDGRPCAKIVKAFANIEPENKKNDGRFMDTETTGDGSVVIRKHKK